MASSSGEFVNVYTFQKNWATMQVDSLALVAPASLTVAELAGHLGLEDACFNQYRDAASAFKQTLLMGVPVDAMRSLGDLGGVSFLVPSGLARAPNLPFMHYGMDQDPSVLNLRIADYLPGPAELGLPEVAEAAEHRRYRVVLGNRAFGVVDVCEMNSTSDVARLIAYHSVPSHLKGHLTFHHHGQRLQMSGMVRDKLKYPTCALDTSFDGLWGGGKRGRSNSEAWTFLML